MRIAVFYLPRIALNPIALSYYGTPRMLYWSETGREKPPVVSEIALRER